MKQETQILAASQTDWIALSDHGILDGKPTKGLMHKGQFVVELSMPLAEPTVLLDYQAKDGWPRTFALLYDPKFGFSLVHRQGSRLIRHVLPGPMPKGLGNCRLTFEFDAPAKTWALSFQYLEGENPVRVAAQGTTPMPLQLADLAVMCCKPRHRALLWFGACDSSTVPSNAAWLGLRTQVETSLGPIAAGNLKRGDVIMTPDQGPKTLLNIETLPMPTRGSFAPVLLRAPFFGQNHDLLVSADQLVAVSGTEVEFLCGADTALIPAAALVDGRTALFDNRRPITGAVMLDLGCPALINADGCSLGLGYDATRELPLRALKANEVLSLKSLLGRNQHGGTQQCG